MGDEKAYVEKAFKTFLINALCLITPIIKHFI